MQRFRSSPLSLVSPLALAGAALTLFACSASKASPDDVGGPEYVALETTVTTTPAEAKAARATHALGPIFVIVMENHDWSDIVGNPNAPYINGTLLAMGAHATNYYENERAVHPSEPNYVWMEAGDNLGITDDDEPDVNHRTTRMHLANLIETAGLDWRSYQQSITGTTCPLEPDGAYAPKHNPMIFFDDVNGHDDAQSPRCIAHVRPVEELARDLAADGQGTKAIADYNFITPDLCHDMHDACGGDPVKNGDSWLAANVPTILGSAAYARGGVIFVTWDESEDGEHPIGMIAISKEAKPGYASSVPMTHSSLLRSAQDVLAVRPYLRAAADAHDLGDLFVHYP